MKGTSRTERTPHLPSRIFWGAAVACLMLGCLVSDLLSPEAAGVRFTVTGDSILTLGSSTRLTATLSNDSAEGPALVEWMSSDSDVALIDPDGLVTTLTAGSVTLSARLSAPDLTVPIIRTHPLRVRFAGINLREIDSLTGIGATRAVITEGLDGLGQPRDTIVASYQSSAPSIVSVNSSGIVTGVSEGSAVITATFDGFTDQETVRMRRVASALHFVESELVFSSLGRDTTLHVEVLDTEGAPQATANVVWSSSDPGAISVTAEGLIRAIKVANATIRARVDNLEATIPVRVGQTVAGITVQAGQGQSVTAGAPVPIQPSVIVRDASGAPIAGVTVTFSVLTGGGVLTDSVRVTDASGLARLGNWILGVTAGPNSVRVETGNFSALFEATGLTGTAAAAMSVVTTSADTVLAGQSATFTLTTRDQNGNPLTTGGRVVGFTVAGGSSAGVISPAVDHGNGTYTATFTGVTAGTPTTITAWLNGAAAGQAPFPRITVIASTAAQFTAVTGNLQTAVVGTAVPVRPAVLVRDAQGNPVSGVAVTFEVGAGGGSIAGSSQATGTDGIARVDSWTLGTAIGGNSLIARRGAQVVTFTATAIAGAVSLDQSAISVSTPSIVAGTSATLTLRARDAGGNQLTTGGLVVAFAVSGGSTTGTIGTVVDHNNGTYSASFLGTTAGTASTVTATIGGDPVTSVGPTITVNASSIASSLSILSGNGQTAIVNNIVPAQLAVVARDGVANPVANAVVTFRLIAGNGTITDSVVSTDAEGIARLGSWTLGTATVVNAVTASTNGQEVSFTATALPGAAVASQSQLTVSSPSLIAGQSATLTVRARDQFGNLLSAGGRLVVFSVTGGTSGGVVTPTTDAGNGTYTASFTGVTAGSAKNVTATLDGATVGNGVVPAITVVPGPASVMSVIAGNDQLAAVAGAVPVLPTVEIRDSYSNVVSSVPVTFAVTAGGGQVSGASQVTGGNGRATVGSWILGTLPGANTLVASAGVLSVTFNATGVTGVASAATSTITSTLDTVTAGASATFTLRARDIQGNLLSSGGSLVVFSLSGGTSAGQLGSTVDNGDGTYSVSFQGRVAGTAATVNATIAGSPVTTARPTIAVIPGAIDRLIPVQGNNQSAVVGTVLGTAPQVRVVDAFDNVIAAAPVVFTVTGGGGSVSGGSTVSSASGLAAVGSWTLGNVAGSNTLEAASAGKTVSFTATGLAGVASAATSRVTVSAPALVAGTQVTLTLSARDQFDNPITSGGATVAFTQSGGTSAGTVSGVTDNGNGTYTATLQGTTAGTATTIGATIGGVAVTTPLPTITVSVGAPASLLVTAGNNQTATVNTAVTTAPQVRVTDVAGNPIVGQLVVFTTLGGGSVTGASQTTGADGRATVGSWTLSTAVGANALRATAGVLTVDFSATATAGPISAAASVVGVSQGTVAAGSAITLTLTGRDVFGNAVTTGGATVVFSLSAGTSNGTIGSVTYQGNGSYSASFSGTTAGTPSSVGATINGVAVTTVRPTVTVTAGAAAQVLQILGNGQTATVSTPLPVSPQVRVVDAFNNPVPGVTVTFAPVGGGTVAGPTQTTSASGLATVTTWTLSTVAGTNTLRATSGTVSTDFTATGTPGAISAANSIVAVSAPTVKPLASVTVTVTIRDQFGNTVSTAPQTVVLSVFGNLGGSIVIFGPVTNNGNGTHTSTLTGVTTGAPVTVSATINGQTIGTTASIQVVP